MHTASYSASASTPSTSLALDCSAAPAASLAAPLAALLADPQARLAGEPAGPGDDEIASLSSLVPELTAAAATLDAGSLPLALDHGDLWPSNVLVGPTGCAFVDWEDVRLAHPFLSLFPMLAGACLDRCFVDYHAAATRIRDEYLAGWSAWAGRAALTRAFSGAHDIAAVAVAANYRRYPPDVGRAAGASVALLVSGGLMLRRKNTAKRSPTQFYCR